MYKTKIGLVAAGLVLGLIVAVYLAAVLPMAKEAETSVQAAVQRASSLVTRVQRLKGFELLGLAESVATRKEFVVAVQTSASDNDERRRVAVFDSIQQFDKVLKQEGRKAHFFGVVGTDGAVLARDLDMNNMYGEKLPFKNVKEALEGRSAKDIWGERSGGEKPITWLRNKMMRSAAAPIRVGGVVKGAVVIAYEVTAADAREERDQFGTNVAYFMDDAVRASSFSLDGGNTEDTGMVEAVTRELLAPTGVGKKAITEDKQSDPVKLVLKGETFLAIAGALPVRLSSQNVGYVVLSSLTAAQLPVTRMRWMFVVLAIGGLLLVTGGMWVVARHFVTGEDKLELGVAEVINGNMEFTFDVIEEFEGLANALNVMLARLLGRPEPGEEGEEGEAAWRADVIFVEELDSAASGPDVVRQLAAESEDAYYSRVFHEYVDARRKHSLPVEGITQENLTQKLRANEALLKAKHKCQMVRFVVNAQGGKVSLKPIRIG